MYCGWNAQAKLFLLTGPRLAPADWADVNTTRQLQGKHVTRLEEGGHGGPSETVLLPRSHRPLSSFFPGQVSRKLLNIVNVGRK